MRRRQSFLLVTLTCTLAARAADPPRPSLAKPVDYVRWVNDEYGKDIEDNAADLYLKVAGLLSPNEEMLRAIDEGNGLNWTAEQRTRISEYLNTQEPALRQFAEAARKKDCFFPAKSESGVLIDWTLPELKSLRTTCKLTAARARLRLLDGAIDGATDDIVTILRFAQHACAQPTLIQYLVGLAADGLAYPLLQDLPRLAKGSADYERLIAKLDEYDRTPPRPLRQFTCEKAVTWDILQRFLRDTDGDGRCESLSSVIMRQVSGNASAPDLPIVPPQPFDKIVDDVAARYDQFRDIFVEDYGQARERATALDKELEAAKGTVVGVFLPSPTRVAVIHRRAIAERHGARAVLALHAYHAKNGKWPADLKDALPGKAATFAIDPFSNRPLIYKLNGDDFLLYSVGDNGTDDSGEVFRKDGKPAWGETGDRVFWPRP